MKKMLFAIVLLAVIILAGYFLGYRGAVNSEYAKIYQWDGKYYQSWTISYSHLGRLQNSEK